MECRDSLHDTIMLATIKFNYLVDNIVSFTWIPISICKEVKIIIFLIALLMVLVCDLFFIDGDEIYCTVLETNASILKIMAKPFKKQNKHTLL